MGPGAGGTGGLPEDIPVLRLNRKLGSRVISCFAKWRSCSGGKLKGTNPFDITSSDSTLADQLAVTLVQDVTHIWD